MKRYLDTDGVRRLKEYIDKKAASATAPGGGVGFVADLGTIADLYDEGETEHGMLCASFKSFLEQNKARVEQSGFYTFKVKVGHLGGVASGIKTTINGVLSASAPSAWDGTQHFIFTLYAAHGVDIYTGTTDSDIVWQDDMREEAAQLADWYDLCVPNDIKRDMERAKDFAKRWWTGDPNTSLASSIATERDANGYPVKYGYYYDQSGVFANAAFHVFPKLYIPDTVKAMPQALRCSNMVRVFNGFANEPKNITLPYAYFFDCANLEYADVSCLKRLNLSNPNAVAFLFGCCPSLRSADVSALQLHTATSIEYMFYSCKALTTIDFGTRDMTLCTSYKNTFYGLASLTEIRGTLTNIMANIDLGYSSFLLKESIVMLFEGLHDYTGSTETHTIKIHATALARLSDAQKLIATSKNWTILS